MTATTTTSGLIQAGTTRLYHEVRGSGPALLVTGVWAIFSTVRTVGDTFTCSGSIMYRSLSFMTSAGSA